MSQSDYYYFRGMLNELKSHTTKHDTIAKHLTQNGDGTGTSHGVMLDSVASSLNDMKQHTNLSQSRLNNIQNHLTQNGDGTGTSHGVMLDSCSSSLNDIKGNASLTASRLNNIQNKLSQNTDGTGLTAGEMLYHTGSSKSIATLMNDNNSNNNSNLAQIRNKLTANGDGTGISAGELLEDINTNVGTTIYGSADNLFDGVSCVAAGTFSSVVDWSSGKSPKSVQISLLATASVAGSGFEVYVSHDGSNYARTQLPNGSFSGTLGNTDVTGTGMNTSGGIVMEWGGHRYMKVKVYCLATFSGTATGLR